MINAFGDVFANWGFAIHSRYFFRALHRRTPLALFPWDKPPRPQQVSHDVSQMLFNARHGVTPGPSIGIGTIDSIGRIRGERRIAYVVWEPTVLPPDLIRHLEAADELWTASEWGRRLLTTNGVDDSRIRVVPEGVDTEMFRPLESNHAERPFRFLTVLRWQPRKGIDDLITAFLREFRKSEPVQLVVHSRSEAQLQEAMRSRGFENDPRIVHSKPRNDRGMCRLYNECDAFVLPHKAEGWGLPIMEAMACARPVIVTGYSAPAEFVTGSTGYLIRVAKMIDVDCSDGNYPRGAYCGQWAQPDLEHLQYLMRHVYENRQEAAETGRQAREEVCAQWTWDHAAEKALKIIGSC